MAGRPSGDKTRCDGQWTEAKFRSFIKNNLRGTSRKWAPIQKCKKNANVSRGLYECAECKEHVPPTIYDEEKRKRVTNIFVDHIEPIIDPAVGWVSWDSTIDRMFCDSSNLQLLCKKCHSVKCQEEIDITKERRQKEKNSEE
ncbi:hypothetical protein TY_42 [Pseudomonas phage vB_PaeM_Ty]|nr:hypothetical protein TY_42 [Pseudomonas phage vB_PaeM_Ty]